MICYGHHYFSHEIINGKGASNSGGHEKSQFSAYLKTFNNGCVQQ